MFRGTSPGSIFDVVPLGPAGVDFRLLDVDKRDDDGDFGPTTARDFILRGAGSADGAWICEDRRRPHPRADERVLFEGEKQDSRCPRWVRRARA